MKYYVDSIKIEEFINNCNGYIEEMKKEIIVMKGLIDKTTWQGNARDAVSLKYETIMEDVNKIPETLTLYIRFMELVIENYGEGIEKLKKEFQEIMEKLKLEKIKNEL